MEFQQLFNNEKLGLFMVDEHRGYFLNNTCF